jgi:hypothetical protein
MKTLCRRKGKDFGRKMGRAEISRLKAFIFLPLHLSATLPPGFEPWNSANQHQTSTINKKLSACFRILPRSSAFFRVSGREACRAEAAAAKPGRRQSELNWAVVGQRTHDLCNYLKSNHLQIKRSQASRAESKWVQVVQDPVSLTQQIKQSAQCLETFWRNDRWHLFSRRPLHASYKSMKGRFLSISPPACLLPMWIHEIK